jgi:hypothetical protein
VGLLVAAGGRSGGAGRGRRAAGVAEMTADSVQTLGIIVTVVAGIALAILVWWWGKSR